MSKRFPMNLRIGLTYDLQPSGAPDERWAEWDRPETVDAIERSLQGLGHDVLRIGSARDLVQRLPRIHRQTDLIFTIAEGWASRTREAWVPTICEVARLPYVGSPPQALTLALDKWVAKRVWQAEGLPVPWGVSLVRVEDAAGLEKLPFPLIVKPRYEGSGIGIDAAAIVHDRRQLADRVAWAIQRYHQPVVVEEFIRGGEFTVCLVGDPLTALIPVQRHIDPVTTLSCHIAQKHEHRDPVAWELSLESTEEFDRQLEHLALRSAAAVGCRDMARVDIRVTADRRPYLLEINPLPSLDHESTFALLAEVLGWGFTGMLQRILDPAIHRTTSSSSAHG